MTDSLPCHPAANDCRHPDILTTTPPPSSTNSILLFPPSLSPIILTRAGRDLVAAVAGRQLLRQPLATLPSPFPPLSQLFPSLDDTCTTTSSDPRPRLHVLSPTISAPASHALDWTSLTRPPPTPPHFPPTASSCPSWGCFEPQPPLPRAEPPARSLWRCHLLLAVSSPPSYPPPRPSSLIAAPRHGIVTNLWCFH